MGACIAVSSSARQQQRNKQQGGQGMANTPNRSSWNDEDVYWQSNYRTRPYASSANRDYTYYQPGYRYGYESANRFQDRNWNDVEADLSKGWNTYEHRGTSTWEQMKDAVRDAWDRVTGNRPVGTR
jgi:hypothetical protein